MSFYKLDFAGLVDVEKLKGSVARNEAILTDEWGHSATLGEVLRHVDKRALASLTGVPRLFAHIWWSRGVRPWWHVMSDFEVRELGWEYKINEAEARGHVLDMIESFMICADHETDGFLTGWARKDLNATLPPSLRKSIDDKWLSRQRTAPCRSCWLPVVKADTGRRRLHCNDACRKNYNRWIHKAAG